MSGESCVTVDVFYVGCLYYFAQTCTVLCDLRIIERYSDVYFMGVYNILQLGLCTSFEKGK